VTKAPHKAERVAPNMALQVEDPLSRYVAEFGCFDCVESVFTRPKTSEHGAAKGVARVNFCALIPIAAVDFDRIIHECPYVAGLAANWNEFLPISILIAPDPKQEPRPYGMTCFLTKTHLVSRLGQLRKMASGAFPKRIECVLQLG
jgi:hypothetical protein